MGGMDVGGGWEVCDGGVMEVWEVRTGDEWEV